MVEKVIKVYVMIVEKDKRRFFSFYEKKSQLDRAMRKARENGKEPITIIRGE